VAELITLTQAAKRRGCSRQWIYYLIRQKRLNAIQVGNVYVLNPDDVDACYVRPRAKQTAANNGKKKPAKRNGNKKSTSRKDT